MQMKSRGLLWNINNNNYVDISTLETECDLLVYQLYGLTEAEIKIVEGN